MTAFLTILTTLMFLSIWAIVSVGFGVLWGNHRHQQGWTVGFNEGYDSAVKFTEELKQ